jgi:aminopeptidase N
MKEVFANFMAAKIVNPAFPNVNHDLRFLVAHYPAAYAVDRTAGTHPIRQELANLDEAGSLYGAIIYEKAPIVMRQLERILGADNFRDGLRVYLKEFQFGNATWLDLIKILDDRTDLDLKAWSHAWVEEAGRPSIRTSIEGDRIAFVQSDPMPLSAMDPAHGRIDRGSKSIASAPVDIQAERAEPGCPQHFETGMGTSHGGGLVWRFHADDPTQPSCFNSFPN